MQGNKKRRGVKKGGCLWSELFPLFFHRHNSKGEGSGACALQMCTAGALPSLWHPSFRRAAEENQKGCVSYVASS